MRVVFAGTPEPAVPSLEALLASRHEVVGVVTRPDAPAGRGRTLRPSPVKQVAVREGLPVATPKHPRDDDFQQWLRSLAPDVCPVVAYGALVPRPVLDIPAHGWVNLHFSLLPAWRGRGIGTRCLQALARDEYRIRHYGLEDMEVEVVNEDVAIVTGTWRAARLDGPVLDKALTRFYYEFDWNGDPLLLQSRALDETGYVQPTKAALRQHRGLNSIYHNNGIQTWHVLPSGEIENVEVA